MEWYVLPPQMGMDWSLREGYAWAEDKEHCEEYGRMLNADPSKVSKRAKKRGLPQLGTLGAGNHYAEIQVVDEIFNKSSASKMGIDQIGQVCIMIHSGSRGLGKNPPLLLFNHLKLLLFNHLK